MDNGIETLLNLAYIYMSYGKAKRATDYLLIARETDKNNLHIKKMLATAFKEAGLPAHALLVLKEIESHPALAETDRITVMLLKSLCLQAQNNDAEAKELFAVYLKARKELARKEFFNKQRIALKNNMQDEEENGPTEEDWTQAQIREFSAPPPSGSNGARM